MNDAYSLPVSRAVGSDTLSGAVLNASTRATCAVDTEGTIVLVNQAWLDLMATDGGLASSGGIGADYLAVSRAAFGEREGASAEVEDGLHSVLSGHQPAFAWDFRRRVPEGTRWFQLRIAPLAGVGVVITYDDITAGKEAQREQAAVRDPMTGLPNRALLTDRLQQALAEGARNGRLVAVGLLEIDDFAATCERSGRAVADAVLIALAQRLSLRIRDGDTLARIADDRFVVVWRDLGTAEQTPELADRLARALEVPFQVGEAEVSLTASIGVSVDTWAQTGSELLLAADAALDGAKRRGPGQLTLVVQEAAETVLPAVRTEDSLRVAMYRDELVLHYQPVIDLMTGTVVGVEALVRWQHPTDGLLGPDAFIPVAESGGLIVALGEWVLQEACAQAVRWEAAGMRLSVAVNVSTRQVAHPSLVPTVTRVLRETGLDPTRLVLEVTETAVMEHAEAAAAVLGTIAALGVSLAIDDFGTGYSSLTYLKRYPIWALKVDKSFVAGMGVNEDDDAIVASVIGLARAVGGSCIAEGVETPEQHAALHALGCDFAQGWLFGRAVAADELGELVSRCEAALAAHPLSPPMLLNERDQAGDERDQAADTRDKRGDQRDQAAAQRDEAGDHRDEVGDQRDQVGDRRDEAADQRDEAADQRDEAGQLRDQAGQRRDRAADRRDEAAASRDDAADQRDEAAKQSEALLTDAGVPSPTYAGSERAREAAASDRSRASADREAGATERSAAEHDRDTALSDRGAGAVGRSQAEQDRSTALADRVAGAGERSLAGQDRDTAMADRSAGAGERTRAEYDRSTATADRGASARERAVTAVDELTGVYQRAAGVAELNREIARARRTRQPLTVVFVGVDHLREINDTVGHVAGDEALVGVALALVNVLRAYDLVIRYRGDEFLCVLSGIGLAAATQRIKEVHAVLAAARGDVTVALALAELQADELADALIARADVELHRRRGPHCD